MESKARICLKDGSIIAEGTSKQYVIEENAGNV